jgi:hypothetical protein
MGIEGHEELSDDEIEARQRAEDGENPDHNPGDADEGAGGEGDQGEQQEAGDGDRGDDQGGQASGADDAQGDGKEPPAAADKTAGGEGDGKPAKVEGVLSKDGSRVLPYGALQAARRDARRAETRAERAEREAAELRERLEAIREGKEPAQPADEELTEEKVAEMEANFPEVGKKMRAAFNRIQELAAKVPKDTPSDDADAAEDDPVQEVIDQIPLLVEWQTQDPQKWSRAVEHDALLLKSPKWEKKSPIERFTEAARRTAEEFDVPFEEPDASTTAAPAAKPNPPAGKGKVEPPPRRKPETLSDFKGGSIADHGTMDVKKAAPQVLLSRMQGMSDEEIDAHLAKYG